MPWKPGESGNPSGRPKDTLGPIVREKTKDGEEIIQKVLGIFRNSTDGDLVLKAARFLAERGWGKPMESISLFGSDGETALAVRIGVLPPPPSAVQATPQKANGK